MADPIRLASDIALLPGVGPRSRGLYARLGIATVGDLLKHLPLRYERHHEEQAIEDASLLVEGARSRGEVVAVRGEIAALRVHPGRRARIEATLEDPTGRVRLVWFNAPWMRGKLHPGSRGLAQGKASHYGGYLQLTNPTWTPLEGPDEDRPLVEDRLRPIYPSSEELASSRIEKAVAGVLDQALPQIVDALPESLRSARHLLPLDESYRRLHRPADEAEIPEARRRLAYDELFLLQLGVMVKRWHLRTALRALPLPTTTEIDRRIRARLPFTLTPDQSKVLGEIAADLARETPMNRLLQGDVGSGKTAVAAYASLLAVAAKHQAAFLAPTEILAEQHAASLRSLLAGSEVRIELLTAAVKGKKKNAIVERIAAGEADLVVGTHALLAEGIHFHSLALVIIDEQHRFGVAQRAILREKAQGKAGGGTVVPHVLVMTATPIPRTLALTVFGDLDVSTIEHLPPGRSPVATKVIGPAGRDEVYRWVETRLALGERAFIVVPAIDESASGLADVTGHLEALAAGPLRGRRLAAMHGRLAVAERDATMDAFRRGDLDAIVATTVIEVGVDVPEATVIVIEHAERFGLAQLHQLRGRVGRGAKPGTCILIGEPVTDEARQRLEAIASTTDGFRIAELDLAIRGPGELVGARQSGLPPFRVADLMKDLAILRDARDDAAAMVRADPTLSAPQHHGLKRKLLHAYGDALGLADVG